MKINSRVFRLLLLFPISLLAACGEENQTATALGDTTNSAPLSGAFTYPNDGVSNTLYTCLETSKAIRDSVELGMSREQIRAIAGKPRHISPNGLGWRYGTDISVGKGPTPSDFFPPYLRIPGVNFLQRDLDFDLNFELGETADSLTTVTSAYVIEFSGDDSGDPIGAEDCVIQGNTPDAPFIQAANDYAQQAGSVDFTDELPMCYDAAIRIAGTVEQGMSLTQVRALVGKPLEIAADGSYWRYGYTDPLILHPQVISPFVFFTQYAPSGQYYVTGYMSITQNCLKPS